MKSSASLLAPLLRSDTQGRLLAELFAAPRNELTRTEPAARAGVAVPTILRDLDRLKQGRYIRTRRVGRARLVSINTEHQIFEPFEGS